MRCTPRNEIAARRDDCFVYQGSVARADHYAQRQAVLDRMRAKMVAAFDESFNADAMQMVTTRIYQATYTQDEVDGLIAFYKTPAGQALSIKIRCWCKTPWSICGR